MAKKQRESSVEEHLRGLLRGLKAENKHLKKQITRLGKRSMFEFQDTEVEELEFIAEKPRDRVCPKCAGKLHVADVGIRTLIKCENCTFREAKKK